MWHRVVVVLGSASVRCIAVAILAWAAHTTFGSTPPITMVALNPPVVVIQQAGVGMVAHQKSISVNTCHTNLPPRVWTVAQ